MNCRSQFFLVWFLLATGCTTANIGPNAAASQTQTATLHGSYEDAFRAAAQVAASMKWNITSSDTDTGVISAKYSGTPGRWGDEVSILIAQSGEAVTVTVRSSLGQRPNREHVGQYLKNLSAELSQ